MKVIEVTVVLSFLTLPSLAGTGLGPTTFDGSGIMPCSAGRPSYDEACGWRVLRGSAGSAEIWISNIAVADRTAYRVLLFNQREFMTRDEEKLQVGKDGDMLLVGVPDKEYCRFSDAVLTGG